MKDSKNTFSESTNILYAIDQLPVFQNVVYDSEKEAKNCPKGDMVLVENLATGLVYNERFLPELVQYDNYYQNEQAVSSVFRSHLNKVMQIIAREMSRKSIVEVGCGKGFFLEMLLANGFDALGLDPTYEGENPCVIKKNFSPELGIQADGLVLRHVLEHIQDPIQFLIQLKDANGGRGKIYIEVPCFEWICKRCAWFDIFYEHVNYFRLVDFYRMFDVVYESGHLFGDQYLYLVAELSSLKYPKIDEDNRVRFPDISIANQIENYGTEKGEKIVVWGGSSKGVIFTLLAQRAGLHIGTVVDINPAKQGKYLPASGLQVQSPEETLSNLREGSSIFVMNSNYLQEIKAMTANKFNYVSIDNE